MWHLACNLSNETLRIYVYQGGKMAEIVERESTASNFIWALTMIIIVAIIMGALYYGGVFRSLTRDKKVDVDVNVTAPAPAR